MDTIKKINNTLIHIGDFNKRIYILKLDKDDIDGIIEIVEDIAHKNKYTKIIAKVPTIGLNKFLDKNYKIEASIPGFFSGKEDVFFMSKFFSSNRALDIDNLKIKPIISIAKNKFSNKINDNFSKVFKIKKINKKELTSLASLYQKTFQTYPFPIQTINYLETSMDDNVDYYGVMKNGDLVAASSAEKDPINKNAEMTDFATLKAYRNNGIANQLLNYMENDLKKENYNILYTLARSMSPGMNIVFSKNGYTHGGTLINNTNICGNIESMNVCYKNITSPTRRS